MKSLLKKPLALAGFAGLIAIAGCADTGGETSSDSVAGQNDLSGISIGVGSKDFTEQLVLGYMLVEAFEAAGADVTDNVDLGGTSVAREALLSGEIDTYMEYNGTGWVVHLGNEDPSFDSEELTGWVREGDLEENGIVWVGRSPFNNTYGFVSSPETTEANGGEAFSLQTMMEYVRDNPDTVVCMESEFPSRPDGLILTTTATGIDLPQSQQLILETGLIYQETAENNCDFGEVFTTDGRIAGLGLTLVEDPGVNILYNVSVNIREEVYNQAPEAFDNIVEAMLAPLTNERMAELNGRVDLEGETARDVARSYLEEEGLL
jgi:osmoprotectant transport system substrate-binding protein